MKKAVSLLFCIVLVFSLFIFAGCGKNNASSTEEPIMTDEFGQVMVPSTKTSFLNLNRSNKNMIYYNIGLVNIEDAKTAASYDPFLLFSKARLYDEKEGNAVLNGEGSVPFKMTDYEKDIPNVTFDKTKRYDLVCDDFSKIERCFIYSADDIEFENSIKQITDFIEIDLSDLENGEYYLIFDVEREGERHGKENIPDIFEYKGLIKLTVI